MTAKLFGGQEVPVFSDFYEAEQAGMLSRSTWRHQGVKVPKETVPAGIVVSEQSLIGSQKVVVPVLEDKGAFLVVALSWCDVFEESQTVKHNKPKDLKKAINSALLTLQQVKNQREGGAGSSLMTEEVLEMPISDGFSDKKRKPQKGEVNNVRAYFPEDLILPDDCPVKEQIYWFLGLLYWKHLERRETWETPINLKYDHLRDNIPHWPQVWDWCKRLELVERTPGYTPGERSYGYWTALPYREQTHRLRSFQHAGLAKRLRAIERNHSSRPILVHLRQQLERLSVDMNEFKNNFTSCPNRHYYHAHLQTILDGELRLTADEFSGRFHSNVSNMYKPLRALLRVDSEHETLGETDIKNSQPLFLALAAKEKGIEDTKYLRLCEEGLIYEHLAGRLGVLRESAKQEMLVMLYAKNGYRSTAKSVFGLEFPRMATFISEVKAKDYKRLSREMQTAERKFVIDTVCARLKRLQPDMFISTIHDAVLARKPDCDLVLSVMREEFSRRGVNPRLEWQDVARHSFSE